jgi:hypothetical protein
LFLSRCPIRRPGGCFFEHGNDLFDTAIGGSTAMTVTTDGAHAEKAVQAQLQAGRRATDPGRRE